MKSEGDNSIKLADDIAKLQEELAKVVCCLSRVKAMVGDPSPTDSDEAFDRLASLSSNTAEHITSFATAVPSCAELCRVGPLCRMTVVPRGRCAEWPLCRVASVPRVRCRRASCAAIHHRHLSSHCARAPGCSVRFSSRPPAVCNVCVATVVYSLLQRHLHDTGGACERAWLLFEQGLLSLGGQQAVET